MSKVDPDNITEYIKAVEENIFPLFAETLKQQQIQLVKILKNEKLNKDQIVSGTIQGMANLSFQLAVKLSLLLAAAMNDPDFDFTDPDRLEKLKGLLG